MATARLRQVYQRLECSNILTGPRKWICVGLGGSLATAGAVGIFYGVDGAIHSINNRPYQPSRERVTHGDSFLGTILGGMIAVPAYVVGTSVEAYKSLYKSPYLSYPSYGLSQAALLTLGGFWSLVGFRLSRKIVTGARSDVPNMLKGQTCCHLVRRGALLTCMAPFVVGFAVMAPLAPIAVFGAIAMSNDAAWRQARKQAFGDSK